MRKITLFVIILLILSSIATYFYYWERKRESRFLLLYGNVDVRQVDLGFRVSGRVQEIYYEEHVKLPTVRLRFQ